MTLVLNPSSHILQLLPFTQGWMSFFSSLQEFLHLQKTQHFHNFEDFLRSFPQPCECALFQNSNAKESFLPYKSSAGVLLESWRFNGVMNFRENDTDRSNYVFSMFSNACNYEKMACKYEKNASNIRANMRRKKKSGSFYLLFAYTLNRVCTLSFFFAEIFTLICI